MTWLRTATATVVQATRVKPPLAQMTPTLNSIAAAGWLVNNLYQLDDGSWRASLRKPTFGGDYFTGFGEGDDLESALIEAFASANEAEFTAERPVRGSVDQTPALKPIDLLTQLNLRTPETHIRRRTIA